MEVDMRKSVEISRIEAYYKGIAEGLRRAAWWRSGKQYVGAQDKPADLEQVLLKLDYEKMKSIGQVK